MASSKPAPPLLSPKMSDRLTTPVVSPDAAAALSFSFSLALQGKKRGQ